MFQQHFVMMKIIKTFRTSTIVAQVTRASDY
jgi:hypothetical protein